MGFLLYNNIAGWASSRVWGSIAPVSKHKSYTALDDLLATFVYEKSKSQFLVTFMLHPTIVSEHNQAGACFHFSFSQRCKIAITPALPTTTHHCPSLLHAICLPMKPKPFTVSTWWASSSFNGSPMSYFFSHRVRLRAQSTFPFPASWSLSAVLSEPVW